MKLKVFKPFLFLITSVFYAQAFSANLSNPDTPAGYLHANPDQVEAFVSDLSKAKGVSEEVKKNLSLLARSKGQNGDALMETMDETTLCYWFGSCSIDDENQMELDEEGEIIKKSDGIEKLYKSAKVGNATQDNMNDCRKRRLCIVVDKSKQTLYAWYKDRPGRRKGQPIKGVHKSLVSTARPGKVTPVGYFNVEEVANADRTSYLYPGAVLGYAVQLVGDIFIHETAKQSYSKLGSRASAGCVRTTRAIAHSINQHVRMVGGWQKVGSSGKIVDSSQVRVLIF